jgi:leucine dehydrogenase
VFEELLAAWDGEHAVIRRDADSGAWMFVCVHSTALGPAGGGTRMRVYDRPGDGLADAMRLSAAMTQKMAAVGVARGGGKGVLAVPALPADDARRRLLRRYGELVASLGGSFRTAGDMNIGPADLDVVAERCPWVYGTSGRGGDSGRGTARGVLHGIRASAEHAFGSSDLAGRTVLVQGCGSVGGDLVSALAAEGATVLVSDVDEARARATGREVVAPAEAHRTECDVYAPCAVGGTLSAATIPELRCRVVAGSANNQLAEPVDALRLHDRGILYAPDYVINAGGVVQLIGMEDEGWDEGRLERAFAGIGDTLRTLYAEADREQIAPTEAADRLVAARLAAAGDTSS